MSNLQEGFLYERVIYGWIHPVAHERGLLSQLNTKTSS